MSNYTQARRPLAITTPLGKDVLLLTGFRGHEAISELFHFAKKVEQYYGTDTSRFEAYSPVHHVNKYSVATFIVHAEIEELLPLRQQEGTEVKVNYDVNPAIAKRVMDGEAFDVGLTNPWYVDEMISLGRINPDIHIPFGRIPLAIGAAGLQSAEIADSHEAVRAPHQRSRDCLCSRDCTRACESADTAGCHPRRARSS